MNKVFVTGAAGFIGSNLIDWLLANGVTVTGWDNFSTGQELFLENALKYRIFARLCFYSGGSWYNPSQHSSAR